MSLSMVSKTASRLALLAGAVTLFGASQVAAAPMLDCAGLPCANVQIADGKTLKLAIDTGNNISIINLPRAKELGLAMTPYLDGRHNPVPGYFISVLKDVRLSDASLGDFKVVVIDLSPDMAKGTFPTSDGTLSYGNLTNHRLELDYRRRTVRVSASAPDAPCAAACGAITYPTFGKKGPPIVVTTGFAVNGQPITVQVDTMYAGPLMIYDASIDKLHLRAAASGATVRRFPFTDGGVDMIESRADKETFGAKAGRTSLYFPTPKVHQPDGMFDGTVGVEAFQGRVVTLDFGANRFWLG